MRKLAAEAPARLLVFDLLVDADGRDLTTLPLIERRARLEQFVGAHRHERIRSRAVASVCRPRGGGTVDEGLWRRSAATALSPSSHTSRITPGDRRRCRRSSGIATADCVVGGFRYASGNTGAIGSLLLGLYNDAGQLDHVGFAASFTAAERAQLKDIVEPLKGGAGFSGRSPGGPSRWSTERTGEWERLKPTLVCEVRYDHFSGGRFRHGTKLLRWRPDKEAGCTFDQLLNDTSCS